MDVSIVQKVFPKYTAAGSQIAAHGVDAWHAISDARTATDAPARLDAVLRATTAFDHAITSSNDIPIGRFVPGAGKYYASYTAAKAVATMILATGVVPGAREHVGRQQVLDGQTEFHRALDASTDTSRFGRFRTGDWMRDANDDAASGINLLHRPDLAQPLRSGLASAAALLQDKQTVPSNAVTQLDKLFNSAASAFDQQIAAATAAHPGVAAVGDLGLAQLPIETAS